jgi:hypothetical protein
MLARLATLAKPAAPADELAAPGAATREGGRCAVGERRHVSTGAAAAVPGLHTRGYPSGADTDMNFYTWAGYRAGKHLTHTYLTRCHH